MGSFQTGFGGGVGSAFPSAATFPHYAIQQGIPYNVYGYESTFALYSSSMLLLSLSLQCGIMARACQLIHNETTLTYSSLFFSHHT